MSMLGALCALLAAAPDTRFGAVAVDIWEPLIPDSDTPGVAFGFSRFPGTMIDTFVQEGQVSNEEQPRVQLIVRSAPNAIDEGEALADAARTYLADKYDFEYDGTHIGFLRCTTGIGWLGKDTNERGQWSIGFEVTF